MTEVLFYQLNRQPLEAVLPVLLQKTLARGWRAGIKATSPERVSALDDHLWTFSDESFLPHGTESDPDAASHPVVIGAGETNPNGAAVLLLVDGAPMPADAADYERIVLLFEGGDPDAAASARQQWRQVVAAGHTATYWEQDGEGRWRKRGESAKATEGP